MKAWFIFFWECNHAQNFWLAIDNLLTIYGVILPYYVKDTILGKLVFYILTFVYWNVVCKESSMYKSDFRIINKLQNNTCCPVYFTSPTITKQHMLSCVLYFADNHKTTHVVLCTLLRRQSENNTCCHVYFTSSTITKQHMLSCVLYFVDNQH